MNAIESTWRLPQQAKRSGDLWRAPERWIALARTKVRQSANRPTRRQSPRPTVALEPDFLAAGDEPD
jgi:hypothetical protein